MPTFTIDISDKAVARLQVMVDAYNSSHGTTLGIKQWFIQHLKSMAISAELCAAVDALEQQKNEAFAAESLALKKQLEDAL